VVPGVLAEQVGLPEPLDFQESGPPRVVKPAPQDLRTFLDPGGVPGKPVTPDQMAHPA
jgi:hypothetical protein